MTNMHPVITIARAAEMEKSILERFAANYTGALEWLETQRAQSMYIADNARHAESVADAKTDIEAVSLVISTVRKLQADSSELTNNEQFKVSPDCRNGAPYRAQIQDGSATRFSFGLQIFDWKNGKTYFADVYQDVARRLETNVRVRVKGKFAATLRCLPEGARVDIHDKAVAVYCELFGMRSHKDEQGVIRTYMPVKPELSELDNDVCKAYAHEQMLREFGADYLATFDKSAIMKEARRDYEGRARQDHIIGYTAVYDRYRRQIVATRESVAPVETTRPHFADMAEAIDCLGRANAFEGLADGSILIADLSSLETPMPVDPGKVVSSKWADNKAMLEAFGANDIRQGSRMVLASGDAEDSWEDYYEVPFTVLDKLRAAIA